MGVHPLPQHLQSIVGCTFIKYLSCCRPIWYLDTCQDFTHSPPSLTPKPGSTSDLFDHNMISVFYLLGGVFQSSSDTICIKHLQ